MSRNKLITGIVAIAVLGAAYFAYAHWKAGPATSRENLLNALPANASTVFYIDVAELRASSLLQNAAAWTANATTDPDYKQFVNETGFDYAKDLDRIGIAVKNSGQTKTHLALADGNFDRTKIETYLRKTGAGEKRGSLEIFRLSQTNSSPNNPAGNRTISIAFLANHRIALTDETDLQAELETAASATGRTEWTEHFERLAGTPVFALFRQDAAIGGLVSTSAPSGLRSPQLAQLLNELLWISIAGKPEGNEFRAVMEGECPNEAAMRQLSEFLNGIALMTNAGLNDPKLRQRMDPGEREAYLQLVNSIDVMRLDRGTSKSVRATFVVTAQIWENLAQAAAAKAEKGADDPSAKASSLSQKQKNGGRK